MVTPTPDNGGIFYQGGCRVHGTSIILPDEESGQLLGTTSNGGHRGHQPDVGTRRRSPHSASVSSSPLASPVPPLGPAPPYDHSNCSDRMHKSCACVSFIAEHTKAREEATKVCNHHSNSLYLYTMVIYEPKGKFIELLKQVRNG